jgi:hypothetical protein
MTKKFRSVVELVKGDVPKLGRELFPVGRDGCVCLGDGLFNRLDGVDGGDGLVVDGHVLGHVRVGVGNDVLGRKRRFLFRNDDTLAKSLAELRDCLTSLGELETFQTS